MYMTMKTQYKLHYDQLLCFLNSLLKPNKKYTKFDNKQFKTFAIKHNSFYFCVIKAAFNKTRYPVLCKQKNLFTY